MSKKKIAINIARFWQGASFDELINLLVPELRNYYDFEISDAPAILLYGPYSGTMPEGSYIKVFVGCENIRPIMSECDWAFGVTYEDEINDPRYMRFRRWGDDSRFIQTGKDWQAILGSKSRFCAFLYANQVPYREAFFKELSLYKRVDAPGRSMNNMAAIDSGPGNWRSKIDFLRHYKFVVAFENSSSPGYNTEKLTDPIDADSMPIYWGDPQIARCYNVRRFVNAHDFTPPLRRVFPRLPYYPYSVKKCGPTSYDRVARRVNRVSAELEQKIWSINGFAALVEEIIRLDSDDTLYLERLQQPFLINNELPNRSVWESRWRKIFDGI